MTKRAERPITVSFQDDSSCTFDSNDFVEFEILTHVNLCYNTIEAELA